MMEIMLAVFSSMCRVGQSAFTKAASAKGQNASSMGFNTMKVGIGFAFFAIISFYNMQNHLPTLLFALCYGIALFFSTLFGYKALMNGSMALTSLLVSYSVIIPVLFGVVFLHETVGITQIFGFLLLLISMYMLNKKTAAVQTSGSWFIFVAITFICNGICSVVQKYHQCLYPSSYCKEFMIYSLFVTFLLFLVTSLFKHEKKSVSLAGYAAVAGILMGLGNYLVLTLSSKMNATILFPIVSILSMLFNIIVSRLCFKDRFSKIQLAGIGMGVISVLLIK